MMYMLTVLIAVVVAFITHLVMYWLDDKSNLEAFNSAAQEGYDEAVRHILKHGIFFDRKASEYKTVSICAIDGEITEEWNKRYNEYLISGHHMAIDVMVRRGVMNKRTGEKFKWRFEKIVKEIGEKHD